MERSSINPHMVYAYIGLWYYDNYKKCKEYMEGYTRRYQKRILQTWFQIQYLYLNVPKEVAQRFEEQALRKKWGEELARFFHQHPIAKNKVLSEQDLKRLAEENPIAKISVIKEETK